MPLIIMALNIMTYSIVELRIAENSMKALSIMTLSIRHPV
jgi:hypothetical protein